MGRVWLLLLPVIWLGFLFFTGFCKNISSRPAVVNIGSIFTFESTIGRVAKIAIAQAVKDVNSDSSILRGTKLVVKMRNSNCSGFLGMVEALQFMETDAVAILGPLSSVSSHIISQVANELQVPLVSFGATDPTLSSLDFPYFVRATQSDFYQMKAVAEIVEHYAWKEVTAIYIDNDYGRSGISALNDQLAARRCKISYKAPIAPGPVSRSNIMDILVKVAMVEARVIILHATPNSGSLVFSAAHYLGMMGSGYVWIATDWLASLLDSVNVPSEMTESMQGVIVLRQHTADSDKKRAFSSRWNRLTGNSLGLSSYGFYAYDAVWILAHAIDSFFDQGGVISFSNDSRINSVGSLHLDAMSIFNDGPLLLKNILDSNFTGLTGPIKFEPDKSITNPAFDVINVVGNGMRRIGYWSNYSGLSTMPPETLYSKPPNRSISSQQLYSVIWPGETVTVPRGWVFPNNGKQLRIGVPNRVSFREFVSKVRGSDNLFKGFCIDVFVAAVNLLPYPVPYQFVSFGDGVQNPSYTELVNLITTDYFDAAIGDIAIVVTNRTRIVDFTQPYAASGLQSYFDAAIGDIAIVTNRTRIVDFTQPFAASGLVVVAPFQRLNTGGWAFLKPFSKEMWAVIALFLLVIGLVVWILEHRINDEFRGSPKQQIATILWFSLSTLFFAHRENTVSTLARSVLLIWLFVVLIINSSYTASLTSILTVQQLFSTIKGMDTLREGDDPIGYQVGSFAEHYLIDELGIAPSRLRALGSPEEYGKALKDGPGKGGVTAIVDERPYVDLFLSSQCTYRVVGQEFTKSGWGFAFPRDSPLAIDLSTAILTLSENGDLQRIHDKWMKQSSCSLDGSELESDQLHLKSFWGLYLICGVACFLALFIYFLQILRQLKHSDPVGPPESVSGRSHSRRIQRILSLMDEKKDPSERKKRRKVEIVEMGSERERELESSRESKSVNIEELSK